MAVREGESAEEAFARQLENEKVILATVAGIEANKASSGSVVALEVDAVSDTDQEALEAIVEASDGQVEAKKSRKKAK